MVYFKSDTTGEKAYEEFYVPGEKIDMERFMSLGVVCESTVAQSHENTALNLTLYGNRIYYLSGVMGSIHFLYPPVVV